MTGAIIDKKALETGVKHDKTHIAGPWCGEIPQRASASFRLRGAFSHRGTGAWLFKKELAIEIVLAYTVFSETAEEKHGRQIL
ncbi:MAG: hypothetical protein J5949_07895 [Oscillospiraceae bacterium]|nr:hypothetical protein [Oscillospiraceae bacterium]